MATQVQFRGGDTDDNNAFRGAAREITVDTQKDTLVVHDGATTGGFPLLRAEGGAQDISTTGDISAVDGTFTGDVTLTGDLTINTDALFVDASEKNVGIGLTTNLSGLCVNSTIRSQNNSNNISYIGFTTYQVSDEVGTMYSYMGGDARNTGYLNFNTNDTERMRIDSSGSLLIGPSGAPATTITAAGEITATSVIHTDSYFEADRTQSSFGVFYGQLNGTNTTTITAGGSIEAAGQVDVSSVESGGGGARFTTDGSLICRPADSRTDTASAIEVYADGYTVSDRTVLITKAGAATFAGNVVSGTDWNSGDGVSAYDDGFLYVRNDSETGVVFAIQNGGNGTGGHRKASITGDGAATFASTVTCSSLTETASDQRFKKNITDANPQLADVTALGEKLRNWDWTDDAPVYEKDIRFLGLVAQEVESICPGIIHTIPRTKDGAELTPESTDEDGNVTPATYEQVDDSYKTIKTSVLIMKLLGAVTELSAKVAALEAA